MTIISRRRPNEGITLARPTQVAVRQIYDKLYLGIEFILE